MPSCSKGISTPLANGTVGIAKQEEEDVFEISSGFSSDFLEGDASVDADDDEEEEEEGDDSAVERSKTVKTRAKTSMKQRGSNMTTFVLVFVGGFRGIWSLPSNS